MFSNTSKTHPKLKGINYYRMVISIFSIVKKMVPSLLHISAYLFILKLNRICFLSMIFILTISGTYIVYFECNYHTLPFLFSILSCSNFVFFQVNPFLLSCFFFFFSFICDPLSLIKFAGMSMIGWVFDGIWQFTRVY